MWDERRGFLLSSCQSRGDLVPCTSHLAWAQPQAGHSPGTTLNHLSHCMHCRHLPHRAGLSRCWCCLESYWAFPSLLDNGSQFSSTKPCLSLYLLSFFSQQRVELLHALTDRVPEASCPTSPTKSSYDTSRKVMPDLLNADMSQLLVVAFCQNPFPQACSAGSFLLPYLLLVILSPESWWVQVCIFIWLLIFHFLTVNKVFWSGSFWLQILKNPPKLAKAERVNLFSL